VATNLSLLQQIVEDEAFSRGVYHTGILTHAPAFLEGGESERLAQRYRDLAAIIAVRYLQQKQRFSPTSPARLASGWHRASRRLPE
jgi:pyruvate carboxylase